MVKGNKYGDDCVLHDKLKKLPGPPPGNTHHQCKEEYVDDKYHQFDVKCKPTGSNNLIVAQPPTSNLHNDCQSEYLSQKSNAGRKYMLLSKTSDVEEELFGHEGWYAKRLVNRVVRPKEKRPKMNEKKNETPEETDVVIINSSDIALIKEKAIVMTQAIIEERKRKKEVALAKRNAIANQRKQLMLKLEADRKKKSGPISDAEMLRKQEDAITLEEARRAMEEREDDVKLMNTICTYSKCVTERDGQKMDKIDREIKEKEYNEKWHVTMEATRHKLIDFYNNQEEQKKIERYEGAKVIQSQIAYNELQRQIAEEQKLQEGLKLQREIKFLIEQEEKKAEEKRLAGIALMKFMVEENKKEKILKEKAKEREMIEEEKRNAYIFAKDQQEQAFRDEQERIQKEKKIAIDKIRIAQENASGVVDALDDLRNQRIFEAHEKTWREKEAVEVEKIRRMNEELHIAREQQKIMKARQIADQALAAEQEFYKILKIQKEEIELAKKEDDRLYQLRMKNLMYLKDQINLKEETKKTIAREKIAEGERLKQLKRVEKLKLTKIKERKLEELKKEGVPSKYQVDIIKLKVGIL